MKFCEGINWEGSNDIDNEIVEACLYTFENLIKKCPKEIIPYSLTILDCAKKLIQYDPNYTYNENEDVVMNNEDDEGWGEEFEDDDIGND